MSERITHEGVVLRTQPGIVVVKIESASACDSCHAKNLCQMSEKTDKEIEIRTHDAYSFQEGEHVDVFLTSGMGLKAVFYAYVLSLLAAASGFFVTSLFTDHQGLWGLGALLFIALYFVGLKSVSKRINRKFSFGIAHRTAPEDSFPGREASERPNI